MRHRSPARWLAPLALVTCAVAVYAVVQSDKTSNGKDRTSSTSATSTSTRTTTTKRTARRRTYTVKSGDVLSAIAARYGVTVAEIERLNPSVDAAALHPGQKLRLSP